MTTHRASWWWYGRYEGAGGRYDPPASVLLKLIYWFGNVTGRYFGPPRSRL